MSKETLAEFLERGGEIKKLPTAERDDNEVTVKSTTVGPPTMFLSSSSHFDIDAEALKNLSGADIAKLTQLAECSGINIGDLSYRSPGLKEAGLVYGERKASTKGKKSSTNADTATNPAKDHLPLEEIKSKCPDVKVEVFSPELIKLLKL